MQQSKIKQTKFPNKFLFFKFRQVNKRALRLKKNMSSSFFNKYICERYVDN